MEAEDHVSQQELQQAMQLRMSHYRPSQEYDNLPKVNVRLSQLRDICMNDNVQAAFAVLKKRARVTIDDDMKIPPTSADLLAWTANQHMLDYMLVVSADIGVWAAMPSIASSPTHTLYIDLSKPYQEFRGFKYGRLGFDPKGRMLYIGRSANEEHWLALAPRTFVGRTPEEDSPPGECSGRTTLSETHYRILVMFLAEVLSKLPHRCHDLHNPYDQDIRGGTRRDFELRTNVV
jgi:hypothetical protein